jgi:hypothetical protein
MSTGLPARVAVVCAALGAVAAAQPSARRKVAVVDLSGDPNAIALRRAFYEQLQTHWALRSLGDATLDAALEGSFDSDDDRARGEHLGNAKKDLADAEDALSQFEYVTAARDAEGGRNELTWVTPTEMVGLYADLTLVLGEAMLGQRHANEAAAAFAHVHRLDPMRQLDPGRYLPEIVEKYAESLPKPGTAKLTVIGKGRVWIDGVDRGTAPATFDVFEGEHIVQLTGDTRVTRGEQVSVPERGSVEIPDQTVVDEVKVRRARRALASAPDAAARAGAMQVLAKLLDVHDAVLIDMRNGNLAVQTWRDRAPGFSEFVAYHDQKPIDLLIPLAPAKPPEEPRLAVPFTPPLHVDDTPWYRKSWIQGSAALGATMVVVGIVLYATREQIIMTPSMVQNLPPGAAR